MWTLDDRETLKLWRPATRAPAVMAFSTRTGGVSAPPYDSLNLGRSTPDSSEAVTENRRRLIESLGLDPERLATAGQVHGRDVAVAEGPGLHPNVDALVTRTRGLTLAVTCADCLPLIYLAPGAVAVAHSGWRGTALGMPATMLETMCRFAGVAADRVSVHLGPSIRGCCYQVGAEVADRFTDGCIERRDDGLYLDLAAAARTQLLDHGAAPDQVHVTPACTACRPDLYFSHRRDGGRTGRHWAVAALLVNDRRV